MGNFEDLTGRKFGMLTVIKRLENNEYGSARWLCRCDCGNEKIYGTKVLKTNKSCGCLNKVKDISGEKFGEWEALYRCGNIGGEIAYMCKCSCGTIKPVHKRKLLKGTSKSCGCKRRTKKGLTKTRQYNIWRLMNERCYNKNNISYKNYGARGIKVCDKWRGDDGFINFYNWAMNNGYRDYLTIDRIDVNGNYEPNNCRWATMEIQSRNRRDNVYIELNGNSKTMEEWAEELNIPASTLSNRHLKGAEDIFNISNKIDTEKYKYISKIKNREKYRIKIKDKYIGVADSYEEAVKIRDEYISKMSEEDLLYKGSKKTIYNIN